MYQIIKRDGSVVPFNVKKIQTAIQKAFASVGQNPRPELINLLALCALGDAETKIQDDKLSVEAIQDSVEKTLAMTNHFDVAKAYILYRENHKNIRETQSTLLNYQKVVDDYLKIADWRVKENSTVSYSLGGLILGNSGAVTANYWLTQVYDPEIAKAHRDVQAGT